MEYLCTDLCFFLHNEKNPEKTRPRIQDGGFLADIWRRTNEIKKLSSYLLEQAAFHLIKAEFSEDVS